MIKYFFFPCFMLITLTGYAQTKNFIDQPYLETSASADTLVVPDRLYLSILIRESDSKNRQSVEKLENEMKDALSALGIDTKKQLMLADLDSNFKNYFLKKTGVLKSKSFSLLVYDAVTAGKVIQALENKKIANVNFQKAEVSNLEGLKLKLRRSAVKRAVEQAEVMLHPLDQKLGKALFISDHNTRIVYGWQNRMSTMEMARVQSDQYQPIEVDFQKVKVSSSVNIKFSIE
ncbi:MAG: SIMPL domain-containing protein [Flavobacteriaceae bacterium]